MKTLLLLPALVMATTGTLSAGQTRTWTQGDSADFEKGILKNLSLRSDGRLSLAPVSRELFDTSSAYLWALAQDSKGNLYAGGGTSAKLYRIPPDGKGKVLADLDALEIHAIAIDARDRVYAATSPDGKIYRITMGNGGNGKPEVFYDPKAKYIWALAFDAAGNLFVATGDRGEIHRVTPDGKGKVFYKTEETHVRSLAVDRQGNLIAGTEPGGLVLRVSPAGEGFVLYQMAKKEVTAVAVAADGAVYAAAVGTRASGPPPLPPPPPAPVPVQVTVNPAGGGLAARQSTPTVASLAAAGVSGVAGGSEVYRIDPDGVPRRVWSHPQDVVYAIAFDGAGRALLGAGNKGNLYRIESPTMHTALLVMPATQVTAFQMGREGRLYAATGNAGKVYEIGPALESAGTVESDVFDSGAYSMWGRVSLEASLNGGQVTLATRSGNLEQPQKNWSSWLPVAAGAKGGRSASPGARFVQWKATFAGAATGSATGSPTGSANGAVTGSPELDSVDVAYLPKNIEPRVDDIESTPPNYRFPASMFTTAPVQPTLSLPPIGKRPANSGSSPLSLDTTPSMQFAKGFVGARWAASDPNGDPLVFTVEIRGTGENQWKLLKDKVTEKYLSWDSTAFPDGEYRIRVTASDAPGNPPAEALTGRMESSPFWIDNTPPKITGLAAVRSGGKLQVKWRAADALNNISKAEYSLDGGEWKVAPPVTRLSDSQQLDYELSVDAAAGEHTVAVRVEDEYANQAAEKVVVR